MRATAAHDSGHKRVNGAAARAAALFDRHGRMVYGLCRMLLRDAHEAEDATQQTFVSVYRSLLAGTVVRDEPAWLAAIARNECRARISARMREPLSLREDEVEQPSTIDEIDRHLESAALRDALGELPERQREALVLRDLLGLRATEVGRALGLSVPAVEALLFRARRTMRARLAPVLGGAIAVPLALRDSLALAIPGFATGGGVGIAAGTGAGAGVGTGLLAKVASTPAAAKVAATVAAVATAGTVATVESDRGPVSRAPVAAITERDAADDDSRGSSADRSGRDDDRSDPERPVTDDRSGRSDDDSTSEDRSGSGRGDGDDGSGSDDSSGSGSSGSGSGSSGSSDSSGSGSGSGDAPSEPTTEPVELDTPHEPRHPDEPDND